MNASHTGLLESGKLSAQDSGRVSLMQMQIEMQMQMQSEDRHSHEKTKGMSIAWMIDVIHIHTSYLQHASYQCMHTSLQ